MDDSPPGKTHTLWLVAVVGVAVLVASYAFRVFYALDTMDGDEGLRAVLNLIGFGLIALGLAIASLVSRSMPSGGRAALLISAGVIAVNVALSGLPLP